MNGFLTLKEIPPTEIHCQMQAVCGDYCVDMSTVHCWAKKWKDGQLERDNLCDKEKVDFQQAMGYEKA